MKYKGTYEFYSTFIEGLTDKIPITIPFNLTPSKIKVLENHQSLRFIHAGNWWNIKNPEKRSKELILAQQMKLANENTTGLMSKNIQPGDQDLKEEEDRLKKIYRRQIKYDKFLYWLLESSELIDYYKKNLEYANWARENNNSAIPIYCSIQVINYESAREWFKKASNKGHNHFCVGVSEFLKYPKYKKVGIKRLFEISLGIRSVINENAKLHFSGVASHYLMPILASFGVSSFDGSTPVTSALAYGTIFNENGYGQRASVLKDNLKKREKFFATANKCKCEVCNGKDIKQIVNTFSKDRKTRVIHNISIWRNLVSELNSKKNNLDKFLEILDSRINLKYFKDLLKIKDDILERYNY